MPSSKLLTILIMIEVVRIGHNASLLTMLDTWFAYYLKVVQVDSFLTWNIQSKFSESTVFIIIDESISNTTILAYLSFNSEWFKQYLRYYKELWPTFSYELSSFHRCIASKQCFIKVSNNALHNVQCKNSVIRWHAIFESLSACVKEHIDLFFWNEKINVSKPFRICHSENVKFRCHIIWIHKQKIENNNAG